MTEAIKGSSAASGEPELPKPEVYRVTWDGGPGWTQYHDERDPLPTEWDDEAPDLTEGFYSGEQVRAILATATQGAPRADLHAAIMNIPCKPRERVADTMAYAIGHRDARHAAAELVAAQGAPTPAQPARKCLYCEREMIVGSECTSASQAGQCDMAPGKLAAGIQPTPAKELGLIPDDIHLPSNRGGRTDGHV